MPLRVATGLHIKRRSLEMLKEFTLYHDPYAQALAVAPRISDREAEVIDMIVSKVSKKHGPVLAELEEVVKKEQRKEDERKWRWDLLRERIPSPDTIGGFSPLVKAQDAWDDADLAKDQETLHTCYSVGRREGFKAGIALMAKHLVPGADTQELLSVIRALTDPEHAEALLASLEGETPTAPTEE
jgi:hypothetical protein